MDTQAIVIEVIKGGFLLTYPTQGNTVDGVERWNVTREVFVSPRKLNQKIKEVIDNISLVRDVE